MNYLRSFTVLVISTLLLLFCTFISSAQFFRWNQEKDEVFKLAKEQDRFILLFVGRTNCPICQRTSDIMTINYHGTQTGLRSLEGPLKSLIDNNYVPWYSNRDDTVSQKTVQEYTAEYDELVRQGKVTSLPFLYVINPDEPEKIVACNWGSRSVEILQSLLTVNLLSDSKLKWYDDEVRALKLAKDQNKYVFKLVGKGASPNCQQLMKQLNVNPLKKLMEENFILLYINASETNIDIKSLSNDLSVKDKSFPYFTIVYPPYPDNFLFENFGYQDDVKMEEILKPYSVSNDRILYDQQVKVSGNTLQITNQIDNERIYLFTATGQQVTSIHKIGHTIQIDASYFPKGVLIVYSSTGWSSRIFIP